MYSAQSVRAVEYTDYISAEGYISLPTSVPWPNRLEQWNTPTTSLQRAKFTSQRVSRDPIGWSSEIYRLHLCRGVYFPPNMSRDPIGCSSEIHRLHLCRRVSFPPSECPVTQSAGAVKIHRLHLCRWVYFPPNECPVTQSAGAVKYTDYISAEG